MIESGRNYLLFDGDCGICTRSSEVAQQIDRRNLFHVLPYQVVPEDELRQYGLDYRACSEKVQVITGSGKVRSGAFAANAFLLHYFPWSLIPIIIYAVPIFIPVEMLVYRLVAKNRYRISQWFGLTACKIPGR